MQFVRVGRVVRALRRRRGWRQSDLARRAVCSQQAISLIERGFGDRLSPRTVNRVAAQLEAELEVSIRWHGGEIERLLDEAHAAMEAAVAAELGGLGWVVRIEVSYAIGHERGAIDLLAFEDGSASLLVVEVKVDLVSAEATARRLDEKVRLAARIARERFGWIVASVSAVLVLPDSRTARRRVEAHRDLFDLLFPCRGWSFKAWLREPRASVMALEFLPTTRTVGSSRMLSARRRIRVGQGRHPSV